MTYTAGVSRGEGVAPGTLTVAATRGHRRLQYVTEHDQCPSKNKTVEYSPFGVKKTGRILEQLAEKGVVARDEETPTGIRHRCTQ